MLCPVLRSREMAPASSRDACCSACATRGSCAAGVWDGSNCWFKETDQVNAGCKNKSRVRFACVEKKIKPGPAPPPVVNPWDSREQTTVCSFWAFEFDHFARLPAPTPAHMPTRTHTRPHTHTPTHAHARSVLRSFLATMVLD